MARFLKAVFLLAALGWLGPWTSQAASGKILKVLPQYLDLQGRHTLSPSLYERDAYQVELRDDPKLRSGMRFMVSWRTPDSASYRLQVELRGSKENKPTSLTIESTTKNRNGGRAWTELLLTGERYESLGDMLAWRVTLWSGDQLLSEDRSFLWSPSP